MRVIAPFLSCIIDIGEKAEDPSKNPLQEAMEAGYSQIFLSTPTGLFKYHSLRPGRDGKSRYVCLPATTIPGLPEAINVKAGIQFLPDGKIPLALLNQVKYFFSEVIQKKGLALEAMIWILWNQEKGYHLHVPDQVVSHGSARYDWSSLPADASIIVDIHSHADFQAFFSGTDDSDDTNCIRFSGVIGHNNKKDSEKTMKFRFSYLGTRIEVQVDELFEAEPFTMQLPDNWLANVKVETRSGGNVTRHPNTYPVYAGGRWVPPGTQTAFPGMTTPGKNNVHGVPRTSPVNSGLAISDGDDEVQEEADHRGKGKYKKLGQADSAKAFSGKGEVPQSGARFLGDGSGLYQILGKEVGQKNASEGEGVGNNSGASKARVYSHVDIVQDAARRQAQEDILQDEQALLQRELDEFHQNFQGYSPLPAGSRKGEDIHSYDPFSRGAGGDGVEFPGDFDEIAINHGVEAARAYAAIDRACVDLAGCDTVIKKAMGDMFSIVEEDHRLSVFQSLYESLPEAAKDKLATYGF